MTYPPQQPGQGGWGQQPGPYGQQPGGQFPPSGPQQQPGGQFPPSGPQQQPGWGQQPGPYGQQQGFDRSNPYGQNPYGQPNPYGQQGGFGAVQPPKKKSPLPWILGGAGGLVAIGLIVTLIFVFTGGPGDPRVVAQEVVDKFVAKDFEGIKTNICDKNRAQMEEDLNTMATGGEDIEDVPEQFRDEVQKAMRDAKITLELGKVTRNGDRATAEVTGQFSTEVTVLGRTQSIDESMNGTMNLIVENGEWKVCELAE